MRSERPGGRLVKAGKAGKTTPVRLRVAAERRVATGRSSVASAGADGQDSRKLIHELQVHQVELEMQGEELRRSNRELEESRNRYQELFDLAPVAYFTLDGDGKIRQANFAGETALGIPRSQFLGTRLEGLLAGPSRAPVRALLAEVREGRPATPCDVAVARPHAAPAILRVQGTKGTSDPACLFLVTDVTGLKMAEEALRRTEERYRALIERSPEGVAVHRDGKIVYGNPALLGLFGATHLSQLLGRELLSFYHPEDHAAILARRASLKAKEVASTRPTELRVLRLDGTLRDVEGVALMFEDAEGPATQVILRDVTERKERDRELREALSQTRRREAEMSALLRVARTALESRSFEDAARPIAAECRAVVGAGTAAVYLETPEGPREVARSGIPCPDEVPPDGTPPRPNLRSSLSVGNGAVGFLEVTGKPGGFSDDEGALVGAFSDMASVALLKSRNLQLLEAQVGERTRQLEEANRALASERSRLFALLDELPLYVFLSSPDRSIIFANRYLREHFGEPVGKPCFHVMGGGESGCTGCQVGKVLSTESPARWEATRPGGKAYEIYQFPFRDPGGTQLVLEVGIEVTELRRSYEAEQRARYTADSLREAILAITRSLDLDTILAALLDHVRRLVRCDRSRVMVLEKDGRLSARAVGEGGVVTSLPQDGRTIFDPRGNPVVQEVLDAGRVVVIPDILAHPEWGRRLPTAYERGWMGVPLIARGRTVGMFSVSRREPGGFDTADVQMAEGLSAQASVAIENALLFDDIRAAQERLHSLSRRLVEVQEEERKAVARELHDEIGQSLTSLLYSLRVVERSSGTADMGVHLHQLELTVQEVLENLHRLAANLRPASLDHLGLEAALRQHLAGVERKTGLVIRYSARGLDQGRLPPGVETALYRVVQEALTNVVRHNAARRIMPHLSPAGRRNGRFLLRYSA